MVLSSLVFLIKININSSYDSESPLLDINSRGKKIYIHRKSSIQNVYSSIYSLQPKMENNLNVLHLVDGEQMVNIHTMHYYSATRRTNYCQIPARWTSSALSWKQPDSKGFYWWRSSTGRNIGTESTPVVSRDSGWGGSDYKGQEEIFWLMDLFYILTTTLCISQNSQNHTLKRFNFTACKLHLIKKILWAWRGTLRLSFFSTSAPLLSQALLFLAVSGRRRGGRLGPSQPRLLLCVTSPSLSASFQMVYLH